MGLLKENKTKNGISLNYHRVVSVNNITNESSIIEVASYINKEERQKEKEWYKNNKIEDMNVFIDTKWYSKKYDKQLNVDSAYEYLKTLEEFENSLDD